MKESEFFFVLLIGWEWVWVWDVVYIIMSGFRDWVKYYSDYGVIFVIMGNLSWNSYKFWFENICYVIFFEIGEGIRIKFEENDFLIFIIGDVGNLGFIFLEFGEVYIN